MYSEKSSEINAKENEVSKLKGNITLRTYYWRKNGKVHLQNVFRGMFGQVSVHTEEQFQKLKKTWPYPLKNLDETEVK